MRSKTSTPDAGAFYEINYFNPSNLNHGDWYGTRMHILKYLRANVIYHYGFLHVY